MNSSQKSKRPRLALFQQDDDDSDNATQLVKTTTTPSLANTISSKQIDEALAENAEVYDYDAAYDQIKAAENNRKTRLDTDRKPRYIEGLLKYAEIRKRDRLLAEEKLMQREREEEGNKYADKEKFITAAYRDQLEELRRHEKKELLVEAAERAKGSSMTTFYKRILEEQAEEKAVKVLTSPVTVDAVKKAGGGGEGVTVIEKQLKIALATGKAVHLNDDSQVVDKRELLNAGLNRMEVSGRSVQAQQHSSGERGGKGGGGRGGKDPKRRQRLSQEMEKQMLQHQQEKKKQEEEKKKVLEQKLQTKTTQETVEDAKQRYLKRLLAAKAEVSSSTDSE